MRFGWLRADNVFISVLVYWTCFEFFFLCPRLVHYTSHEINESNHTHYWRHVPAYCVKQYIVNIQEWNVWNSLWHSIKRIYMSQIECNQCLWFGSGDWLSVAANKWVVPVLFGSVVLPKSHSRIAPSIEDNSHSSPARRRYSVVPEPSFLWFSQYLFCFWIRYGHWLRLSLSMSLSLICFVIRYQNGLVYGAFASGLRKILCWAAGFMLYIY